MNIVRANENNLPTENTNETATSYVAAQAKAVVEARYVMAIRRPRQWDQVRQDLLKECKRPSFARNESAYYRKPIGAGVEGLGIRFVEVALRCMTNVLVETTMIFEDESKEIHRVSVTDLESNLTYPMDVRVTKTVERSKADNFISVRKNSSGRNVYTVIATEDDLLNKRAAQISKAIRTLGLRIIPGDLQDEAKVIIKKIRLDEAARDPNTERKSIADAFGEMGVKAADLSDYLGHSLDSCSPSEMVNLRGIYGAIRDGETTWKSVIDNKNDLEGEKEPAKKEIPICSNESFEKKKSSLMKAIKEGKTVNDLIAMIQTREILTDDQKMEIASWQNNNQGGK